MQNDKLLPCPFCGYHGTLHSIDMCNTVYAVCMKCGSRTMDFENGEDAIKHWNTRKPMERIVEQLEESKSDWNDDYNVPITKAIEIVRNGGKE